MPTVLLDRQLEYFKITNKQNQKGVLLFCLFIYIYTNTGAIKYFQKVFSLIINSYTDFPNRITESSACREMIRIHVQIV